MPVYQNVYRPSYYQPRQTYYYDAAVRYQSYDYSYDRSYEQSRCRDSRWRFSIYLGF